VLADLQERQVVLEPSELPAKEGDQVYIKLNIKRVNPAEGEIPGLVTDRRMPVVISSPQNETKGEWPFPGFSQQLLGLSSGDEKTFPYTYPENSDYKELRGILTEFQVKVEEIKKRILPELTDEFAQGVGEQYENLSLLTEDIRKTLERQSKEEYDNSYNDKIMKELLKGAIIKYPPQMLERETDIFIEQLENRLAQQKMDMETYLKMRKIDSATLHSEIKPQAEERLKRTLVLLEIAKAENIHVENSELESESLRTLDEIGRMMPAEKARKTLTNEFVRGMLGNIGADLLVKHTWEHLQSVARGEKEEQLSEPKLTEETEDLQEAKITEKAKKKKTTKKVDKNEPK
jgi:trigger factor